METEQTEQIAGEFLVKAMEEIVRKFRAKELSVLRCENALMRWSRCKAQPGWVSGTANGGDLPIEIQPPRTLREAMRRVINGTPMDCYAVYKKVKAEFPKLSINLESCQVGLRAMKRSGDLEADGTAPNPGSGPPCTKYVRTLNNHRQAGP